MSEDARNSIYLWTGGLTFFGLFWVTLHYNVFKGISDTWLWPLLCIVTVINLVNTAWHFLKRQASNPDQS